VVYGLTAQWGVLHQSKRQPQNEYTDTYKRIEMIRIYVYRYIYIYTYERAHIHIHTHKHTHTHTHTHTLALSLSHTHIPTCICKNTDTHFIILVITCTALRAITLSDLLLSNVLSRKEMRRSLCHHVLSQHFRLVSGICVVNSVLQ